MAAFAVAFYHVGHDAIAGGRDPRGVITAIFNFMPWEAGVDVFFVISGFVIVHSAGPLFATPNAAGIFIRRRLTRIVPLYWIMTTAFLVVLLLDRNEINGAIGGPLYLLASYLFIPWPRPDGLVQPALGLGWSLNYEIFFYALITPFVALRRGAAVTWLIVMFCAFVALGQFMGFANPQLAFWSNPIILEFSGGMVLAQLLAAGVTLETRLRYGLVLLGIAMLHFSTGAAPEWRALFFGVPGCMFAASACLGAKKAAHATFSRLLILLGDASYAMYLVHPFIMRGLAILWRKFHAANDAAAIIYVVIGLTIAQICAVFIHVYVERKLSVMLRRRAGVLNHETV